MWATWSSLAELQRNGGGVGACIVPVDELVFLLVDALVLALVQTLVMSLAQHFLCPM